MTGTIREDKEIEDHQVARGDVPERANNRGLYFFFFFWFIDKASPPAKFSMCLFFSLVPSRDAETWGIRYFDVIRDVMVLWCVSLSHTTRGKRYDDLREQVIFQMSQFSLVLRIRVFFWFLLFITNEVNQKFPRGFEREKTIIRIFVSTGKSLTSMNGV